MDSLPKEKLDIKLIPYDVFGLPKEEKQKLRDLLASYGFPVRHASWEGIKCFEYAIDRDLLYKTYSKEEISYITNTASHCISEFRYYYFDNGKLIRSEESIKLEEENKKRWEKEFNAAAQRNK